MGQNSDKIVAELHHARKRAIFFKMAAQTTIKKSAGIKQTSSPVFLSITDVLVHLDNVTCTVRFLFLF